MKEGSGCRLPVLMRVYKVRVESRAWPRALSTVWTHLSPSLGLLLLRGWIPKKSCLHLFEWVCILPDQSLPQGVSLTLNMVCRETGKELVG